MNKIKKYLWNILISIDQFANTILGGDPDETISSRTEKYRRNGHKWAIFLSYLLNKVDTNHTQKTVEEDEGDRDVIK